MSRPLRKDYPGATHHVFVRGVARSAVALDDEDYERALFLLGRTVARFELSCHAWCFLPNHSHVLVTSELGNLSRAMHWLGTCTAQRFNKRYERAGHLYQGRFGSRLVLDDNYLLELARYLPLNPVRAGLCSAPAYGSLVELCGDRGPTPGALVPASPKASSTCSARPLVMRDGLDGGRIHESARRAWSAIASAASIARGPPARRLGSRHRGRAFRTRLHKARHRESPRSKRLSDRSPTRADGSLWELGVRRGNPWS